jgi:hypothetical protein
LSKAFYADANAIATVGSSYLGWHGDAVTCGDGWMDNLFIFNGVVA